MKASQSGPFFMIRGTPPPFPHGDSAGGAPSRPTANCGSGSFENSARSFRSSWPRGQAEDALAEHVGRQMADLAKLAGLEFAEHLAGLPCQAEPPVKPPRQQEAAVTADGAAPKSSMIFLLRFP